MTWISVTLIISHCFLFLLSYSNWIKFGTFFCMCVEKCRVVISRWVGQSFTYTPTVGYYSLFHCSCGAVWVSRPRTPRWSWQTWKRVSTYFGSTSHHPVPSSNCFHLLWHAEGHLRFLWENRFCFIAWVWKPLFLVKLTHGQITYSGHEWVDRSTLEASRGMSACGSRGRGFWHLTFSLPKNMASTWGNPKGRPIHLQSSLSCAWMLTTSSPSGTSSLLNIRFTSHNHLASSHQQPNTNFKTFTHLTGSHGNSWELSFLVVSKKGESLQAWESPRPQYQPHEARKKKRNTALILICGSNMWWANFVTWFRKQMTTILRLVPHGWRAWNHVTDFLRQHMSAQGLTTLAQQGKEKGQSFFRAVSAAPPPWATSPSTCLHR